MKYLGYIILLYFFLIEVSLAVEVLINVKNPDGADLKDIVVAAYSNDKSLALQKTESVHVIDQIEKQFSPRVSVIQTGSSVEFPNSDSIKHHIYSFSQAKSFQVKLYRDKKPTPILFDKSGLVTLGCNVHDWMIGYIYVVNTPFHDVTDEDGNVVLNLMPGHSYTIELLSPRMHEKKSAEKHNVTISTANQRVELILESSLAEERVRSVPEDDFDDY